MPGRLRAWWQGVASGIERPARRVTALAVSGFAAGLGEAAVVVLIVTVVSRSDSRALAFAEWLPSSTWALTAAALGAVLVTAVAHAASAMTAARAGVEAQSAFQQRLVVTFLDAPWPAQAASRVGELQELATARTNALAFGVQETAQTMATVLNLAVLLVAAAIISPFAMVALLGAVAVVVLLSLPARRHRRNALEGSIAESSQLAVGITEASLSARDLRVFGVTAAAQTSLRDAIRSLADTNMRLRALQAATPPLTRDATVALIVLGLALVIASSSVGTATLGSTVVLMLRALAHGQGLASFGARLEERTRNLRRLEDHIAGWTVQTAAGTVPCGPVERIELRKATYAHAEQDRPAVAELSLDLRRGEQVGIVGRTGAGKSTLASVLLGLLTPDSGGVLVDGVALHEIEPESWHTRTAWVGQEPRLVTGTVADNIRFYRNGLDDELLLSAARTAGLGPELGRWTDGLRHPVGPAGNALSGGQRQRVALARALAGDPALLVLDEPTSALDAHAEAAVRDALDTLRSRAIVVVIAHRLSTVRRCDRLVVLEDGRITATGPPATLETENDYLKAVLALSR